MIYGDVDSQAAKKILNKIMYFGRPDYNLPFLWALVHDFRMAAQVVLSSDEFAYLRDMFNDRRNPQATRLFYAISKYERAHVDRMSRAVEEHSNERLRTTVYMFDGFIAMPTESQPLSEMPEEAQRSMETYGRQFDITWKADIL